jgi:hypothetical protein
MTSVIIHLPDALTNDPASRLAIYHRCSTRGQAGKGKEALIERSRIVMDEIRKAAPGKLKHTPFYGVEEGKLSKKRPALVEAANYAKEHSLILVAADLSRFVRSEAYDRRTNHNAVPTEAELRQLHELTFHVPLATLLPPECTESERHSKATKRSGKRVGREPSLDPVTCWKVLMLLGQRDADGNWEHSLTAVAKRLAVGRSAIQRLLHTPVPPELGAGGSLCWKDLEQPARAYNELQIKTHQI